MYINLEETIIGNLKFHINRPRHSLHAVSVYKYSKMYVLKFSHKNITKMFNNQ